VTKARLAGFVFTLGLLAHLHGGGPSVTMFVGWCAGVLTMLIAWGLEEARSEAQIRKTLRF